MKIHFVTVLDSFKDMRCWGFFSNIDTAEQAIKENWTDIFENGSYNYALIESYEEGLCRCGETRWFQATPLLDLEGGIENYSVTECPQPEEFKGMCNFSIG